MAPLKSVVVILLLATMVASTPSDVASPRRARTFGSITRWLFGTDCGDCPPHHCKMEDSVLRGYCCGCARFFDSVPLNCPPDLQCPLDSRGLCKSYDYMMDCCC